jgi:hypothetical protein
MQRKAEAEKLKVTHVTAPKHATNLSRILMMILLDTHQPLSAKQCEDRCLFRIATA